MPKKNTKIVAIDTKATTNVIDIVNERIINALAQGRNPWKKGWKTYGKVRINRPMNYVTNKPYSGINTALLDTGYYLSWKQVHDLGGEVIDPKNYFIVVFWKRTKYNKTEQVEDEDTGELIDEVVEKNGLLMKYYRVFALENTKGIKKIRNREKSIDENVSKDDFYFDSKNIDELDKIVDKYIKREKIKYNKIEQDRCFYRPSEDSITMPLIKQFERSEEFYSSLFHEMGHSTGHEKRLNRDIANSFGNKKYAKEELVAEITSSYIMSHVNMWDEKVSNNNVAYLQGWVAQISKELDTKKWLIYQATIQAQKAYELIMGLKTKEELVGSNA